MINHLGTVISKRVWKLFSDESGHSLVDMRVFLIALVFAVFLTIINNLAGVFK